MFIILDMKKNKIDHFSLKIIVLTGIVKTGGGFNHLILRKRQNRNIWFDTHI
jgi:hypothetical protein